MRQTQEVGIRLALGATGFEVQLGVVSRAHLPARRAAQVDPIIALRSY